mgnify:CR=1 FL=1
MAQPGPAPRGGRWPGEQLRAAHSAVRLAARFVFGGDVDGRLGGSCGFGLRGCMYAGCGGGGLVHFFGGCGGGLGAGAPRVSLHGLVLRSPLIAAGGELHLDNCTFDSSSADEGGGMEVNGGAAVTTRAPMQVAGTMGFVGGRKNGDPWASTRPR